jgi:hypothetical protein
MRESEKLVPWCEVCGQRVGLRPVDGVWGVLFCPPGSEIADSRTWSAEGGDTGRITRQERGFLLIAGGIILGMALR